MERLRMEDVVTQHPPESRLELGPQERGAEPQVLVSVHLRVRHGGVPLRPSDLRARDVYVLTFPRRLPLGLDLAQVDRSRPALRPCPRARAHAWPRLPPQPRRTGSVDLREIEAKWQSAW